MRIGVVGAGTMGAGIAQVSAQAGFDVLVYDVGPGPLEAGLTRIRSGYDRLVALRRMDSGERDAALARITMTLSLADFATVDFVIEAAPEALELKRGIFQELDRHCRPEVILATNTSSLSVTEVGGLTARQPLVVGMHFFNPVPAMKLVEVVRAALTSPQAVSATTELAERLGKTPVQVKDTPGFVVNRAARAYPNEALRIYGDGLAGIGQVDRIARMGGQFRMGPFELMDLVGLEVNMAVNCSIFEQFFQEPRFRPHPVQARMVKAGLLGRKTGQGWYQYNGDQIKDGPQSGEFFGNPAAPVQGITTVCVIGDTEMAKLVAESAYEVTEDASAADLVIVGMESIAPPTKPEALVLVEASARSLSSVSTDPKRTVGYSGLPSVAERKLVEVAVGMSTAKVTWQKAAGFFRSLGRDVEVIHESPGLVMARIIACLVNESAYALQEGVASAADIDTAMRLGVNYPKGPLEWADQLGPDRILRVLTNLQAVYGDDRYRPALLLRNLAIAGMRFYESELAPESDHA